MTIQSFGKENFKMADSAVIGVGFQSAVDFPELEGSVKRNLVTKRSDFEGYIHVFRELFS